MVRGPVCSIQMLLNLQWKVKVPSSVLVVFKTKSWTQGLPAPPFTGLSLALAGCISICLSPCVATLFNRILSLEQVVTNRRREQGSLQGKSEEGQRTIKTSPAGGYQT